MVTPAPEVDLAPVVEPVQTQVDGVIRVETVVGILTGPGGILMYRRSASSSRFPGRWDFPGGHVEPGEAHLGALARELLEEAGVMVDVASLEGPDESGQGDFDLCTMGADCTPLHVTGWAVHDWTGTPFNAATHEHSDMRWVSVEEALDPELSHAEYRPFLRALPAHMTVPDDQTRKILD